MTVGELIHYLSKFKDDTTVALSTQSTKVYEIDEDILGDGVDIDSSVCWINIKDTGFYHE